MKKILLSGFLSGLLLYFTADIDDSVFSAGLTVIFVLCGIIAIWFFLKHRAYLKMQFLSGLLTQFVFWGLFIFDSTAGITRSVVAFPDDNYAGGIVLLFFWLTFTAIAAMGFICTAVVQYIRKSTTTK